MSTTSAVDFQTIEKEAFQDKFNFVGENATVGAILTKVIPLLFTIAGLLLLLYLIWGGFALMVSRGDPKAMESAKGRITNAVVGFIIVFVAFWLVQLLGLILGIEVFGQIFPGS